MIRPSASSQRHSSRETPLPFGDAIPDAEWRLYEAILRAAQSAGLPFALGGGFAYSAYSGLWRNTKDIDLYILPEQRQQMIDIVTQQGFTDYFSVKGYDRSWIYRSTRDDVIADIIWDMPNHRAAVDEHWLTHGQMLRIRDVQLRAIPPEELIFAKLYVFQRERCDWPDLLSIIHKQATSIDWDHLFDRVADDAGLLGGLMRVFAWLCPQRASTVPEQVWARLGLTVSPSGPDCAATNGRARLLDSRPWFVPLQLADQTDPDHR